jgi:hypothetical protein
VARSAGFREDKNFVRTIPAVGSTELRFGHVRQCNLGRYVNQYHTLFPFDAGEADKWCYSHRNVVFDV